MNSSSQHPTFSLSTNWNSARHQEGEAIADEIMALGFDAIELGYRIDEAQAAGILRRVAQGAARVSSLHAFCPVPLHATDGHPELYMAASPDDDERAMAVILVEHSLETAQNAGATAVVLHAGRIAQKWWWWPRAPYSNALIDLLEAQPGHNARLLKLNRRAAAARRHHIGRHLDALRRSLDSLLPRFAKAGVTLCLENLPSWEALPAEDEMAALVREYQTPALAQWYDIGHGQVRQNLGWCPDNIAAATALLPFTRGVHIHDVLPPAGDHQLPGDGVIDFTKFSFYAAAPVIRVLEPHPSAPAQALTDSLARLRQMWRQQPADNLCE